ncbi:MAG: V-type ATPase subunit [Saccharofermentanales bacterium]|nr:V-type ATPase subunit [Clostridiaceae bacterium]
MRGKKPLKTYQYNYASGRIRAMELQLLDSNRLNRLYEARSTEDIMRILADSGYPAAPDPEASLAAETAATYKLIESLIADGELVDALKVFNDFHNLKVVLKSLLFTWSKTASAEEAACDVLPESSSSCSFQSCVPLVLEPSLVAPPILFVAIRDRQPDLIPAWLYQAALTASQRYLSTYDLSMIDLFLDRAAARQAELLIQHLDCPFLSGYLSRKADLANLGMLLRTRLLRSGKEYLEKALLPTGTIANQRILDCYAGDTGEIKALYDNTPYTELAALAENYGEPGTATRFSQIADNLVIDWIRTARWSLSGPDIPLAYLIGREMEIKNIRIVLTCLLNGIPVSQAREMARERYLTWR